jgi:hypothetical protein
MIEDAYPELSFNKLFKQKASANILLSLNNKYLNDDALGLACYKNFIKKSHYVYPLLLEVF